jgi:hypothetical protein
MIRDSAAADLADLRESWVHGTDIAGKGAYRLPNALPKCKILY